MVTNNNNKLEYTMKKAIASIVAAAALGSVSLFGQAQQNPISDLSISAAFDFETSYVFRGKQLAQQSFQPSIEFGYPVFGATVYAGVWTNQPIKNQDNEIDFYGGVSYPFTDWLTGDVGFTYYWYPQSVPGGEISQTREIYVGLSADTTQFFGFDLQPATYFFYDFDLEQTVIEFSLGYSFDVGSYVGVGGLSLDVGAYYGYLSSSAYNGSQRDGAPKWKNGYGYVGAVADVVYAFNDFVTFSMGVRWAANNDGKNNRGLFGADPNEGGSDNTVWFGTAVGIGF